MDANKLACISELGAGACYDEEEKHEKKSEKISSVEQHNIPS